MTTALRGHTVTPTIPGRAPDISCTGIRDRSYYWITGDEPSPTGFLDAIALTVGYNPLTRTLSAVVSPTSMKITEHGYSEHRLDAHLTQSRLVAAHTVPHFTETDLTEFTAAAMAAARSELAS